jgi:hypothetical protein
VTGPQNKIFIKNHLTQMYTSFSTGTHVCFLRYTASYKTACSYKTYIFCFNACFSFRIRTIVKNLVCRQ